MNSDNFFSLSPINFFQLGIDCHYVEPGAPLKGDKYRLPDTSVLCGEKHFATVSMGWNKEGIEVLVNVDHPIEQCSFPDVTQGDSVELCFDTRDVKTSGFNTRFCHHFYFLPEAVEGNRAGEITRFRTEDTHELCDSKELKVSTQSSAKKYTMKIFIPSQCLHGYDPDQFDRLGFTYRINRFHGEPQHFSVVTEEYQIEQQPSLWSSVKLK